MVTRRLKLILLILSFLLFSAFGYLGYQSLEKRSAQSGKVAHFLKAMETFQRRQLKDLPVTAVPFYGDSLVQGLAVSRANPFLANFGIGHDDSENLLSRVRRDLQHRKFSEYAVAIGINDLGRGVDIGDLHNNIMAIIETLAFADTVYVHTVLPVAASRVKATTMNGKVRQINNLLSELPINYQNVFVIDTYGTLSAQGFLPESFHIGDGLHLNSVANRQWAELLSAAMMR